MSTEKPKSDGGDALAEFLFFLILLPSYVLLNGVFAKTRGRIKDISCAYACSEATCALLASTMTR